MDPNQVWSDILEHFHHWETNEIKDKAADLLEWIQNGGFYPKSEFTDLGLECLLMQLSSMEG